MAFQLFQCSQQAVLVRNNRVLILKFTGQEEWGLPGGRIDVGEKRDEAFARELKEEISLTRFRRVATIDYDVHYSKSANAWVIGAGILIQNDDDLIVLSDEHEQQAWVEIDELESYPFAWPHARDLIRKGVELSKELYE